MRDCREHFDLNRLSSASINVNIRPWYTLLTCFFRKYYSFQELTGDSPPDGVDPSKLETYLRDDEFEVSFKNCPLWPFILLRHSWVTYSIKLSAHWPVLYIKHILLPLKDLYRSCSIKFLYFFLLYPASQFSHTSATGLYCDETVQPTILQRSTKSSSWPSNF